MKLIWLRREVNLDKINAAFAKTKWEIWFLCILAVALKSNALSIPFFWDELNYARPAEWLLDNGLYKALPGLHSQYTFTGHIPGFSFLLAFTFWALRMSIQVARILVLALNVLGLVFVYKLGAFWGGRLSGLCSAIAYFFLPIVYSHFTQVEPDSVVAAFGITACYFAFTEQDSKYLFFALLASTFKETALAIVLPVFFGKLLYLLLRRKFCWTLILKYFSPVAVLLCFFLFEKLTTGSFTNFPFMETVSSEPVSFFKRAINYWLRFFWSDWSSPDLKYLTLCGGLGSALLLVKEGREKRWTVWVSISICICSWLGISFFTSINSRYILMAYPLLCALASGVSVLFRNRTPWILVVGLAFWVWICPRHYYRGAPALERDVEDNMQYADVVDAHLQAAKFLEETHFQSKIYAPWPFTVELTTPSFGYVHKPLNVIEMPKRMVDYDIVVTAESTAVFSLFRQMEEVRIHGLNLEKVFYSQGMSVEIWSK